MGLKRSVALISVLAALATTFVHRRAALVRSGVPLDPAHVRGALHVHTGLSADGYGSLDGVARAAVQAALDFVVVTDHGSELPPDAEGYRHGVLLLGGIEKSSDAGHALALGLALLPFRLDGDPASVVRDVADLGGFLVAAHPKSRHAESCWTGGFTGVSGVEILNLAEPGVWPAGLALLAPSVRYLADPQGALLRALRFSRSSLEVWDRVLRERPLAGLLGSDAHGGFPSHREIFRLASQHLLLERPLRGELVADRALVLAALRRGRGWVALDALADASRFAFQAESAGRVALAGESLALEGGAEIRVAAAAPAGTELVLLRNGSVIERASRVVHRTDETGTYRVEAYLPPALVPGTAKPWILSGAIDVYSATELAAREEQARRLPPLDSPPLPAALFLDVFEERALSPRWQIDRSSDARAATALVNGALRFDFKLGGGPKTHASVCDYAPRDLSDARGLVFRVRADRRFRFDVQLRVADASTPEGVRIWRHSVRAEPTWRTLAVPFADLKTYDQRAGRPELARARGIYFHVDEAQLAPGSAGTLWIDDVGLAR